MKNRLDFLPTTMDDVRMRNWSEVDFVYVTGDAYVDHPSFGAAIITRVLEADGFRVAVLSQPDFRSCEDFRRFGRRVLVSSLPRVISIRWWRITPCLRKNAPTTIIPPAAGWVTAPTVRSLSTPTE